MAKYENILANTKQKLGQTQNILIALPSLISIDKLASGLALFLALKQIGKNVSIVTEGQILVAHSNLFGVGSVKNDLPKDGGNLILTLEGVVDGSGNVPALEKLDWHPVGSNLNLVFHVLQGQKFEPKSMTPSYAGSSKPDLVFVIGVSALSELGKIYPENTDIFSSAMQNVISINNNPTNFGQVKIEEQRSTLSEIISQVIPDLGLKLDADIASNILAGIYEATNNLTVNIKPETFMVIGQAMQVGGKIPTQPQMSQPAPIKSEPAPVQPTSQVNQSKPSAVQNQPTPLQSGPAGFDIRQFIPPTAEFTVPNVQPQKPAAQPVSTPIPTESGPLQSGSTEERPTGEQVSTGSTESPESTPAPDWLTPKVFKGGSLG